MITDAANAYEINAYDKKFPVQVSSITGTLRESPRNSVGRGKKEAPRPERTSDLLISTVSEKLGGYVRSLS